MVPTHRGRHRRQEQRWDSCSADFQPQVESAVAPVHWSHPGTLREWNLQRSVDEHWHSETSNEDPVHWSWSSTKLFTELRDFFLDCDNTFTLFIHKLLSKAWNCRGQFQCLFKLGQMFVLPFKSCLKAINTLGSSPTCTARTTDAFNSSRNSHRGAANRRAHSCK